MRCATILSVFYLATSAAAFSVESSAFMEGAAFPRAHTCDGADSSPPLTWRDVPAAARVLALIMDDPDAPAGTWTHWVAYDFTPTPATLPAAVPSADGFPGHGRQGLNDFGRVGYAGPCPPGGPPHTYRLRLYALDAPTGLPPRATKHALEDAMRAHVVGQAELHGTYARERSPVR